ncbi:ROK family transcriptional regulator [Actinobacteria bacterium YIM 96077]|uniref:ROK family transcriptional regulator n=2 Tax=Phytoactinopolyspora halophila TaxID=1981511 RepID=A0A329QQ37_9ACTN|nr:ROK family transcriptional regulator [Actinobacteria bacterium YIM 96077]RAW13839.1 ROK family transcriptional regulator [Phytoactinopolyspora halophila]
MRELNSSAILRQLRAETSMSVSALAKAVGLSRQAVTRSLNALESEGLIEFEGPDRESTRAGRPAQLVRFRAEAGYVLGLSISPQDLRVALADLGGTVAGSEVVQLPAGVRGDEAVHTLLDTVRRVLESAAVASDDVWFTSVGAPGIVDPAAGVIKLIPSMPGLAGDILVRRLAETLGGPVYLDNDVKLATQGERWRGAERREDSLVMVHWGERVGAGIVLHGELYRGASNDAGDVGFLDLLAESSAATRSPQGLGPFEEWVGAVEIVRLASVAAERCGDDEFRSRLAGAGERALGIVLDAVVDGAPAALEAIDVVAGRFAKGVAAIRAVLDPRLIVIGGPLARCGETLLAAVRRQLDQQPLNQPALEVSTLGDDAVVYGALHHSLEEIDRTTFDRVRGPLTTTTAPRKGA